MKTVHKESLKSRNSDSYTIIITHLYLFILVFIVDCAYCMILLDCTQNIEFHCIQVHGTIKYHCTIILLDQSCYQNWPITYVLCLLYLDIHFFLSPFILSHSLYLVFFFFGFWCCISCSLSQLIHLSCTPSSQSLTPFVGGCTWQHQCLCMFALLLHSRIMHLWVAFLPRRSIMLSGLKVKLIALQLIHRWLLRSGEKNIFDWWDCGSWSVNWNV